MPAGARHAGLEHTVGPKAEGPLHLSSCRVLHQRAQGRLGIVVPQTGADDPGPRGQPCLPQLGRVKVEHRLSHLAAKVGEGLGAGLAQIQHPGSIAKQPFQPPSQAMFLPVMPASSVPAKAQASTLTDSGAWSSFPARIGKTLAMSLTVRAIGPALATCRTNSWPKGQNGIIPAVGRRP